MRTTGPAIALLLLAGCSSTGSSKAAKPVAATSASIQEISASVTKSKTDVDTAVTALAVLTESSSDAALKTNFDRFDATIEGLKGSAQQVRDHFTQLRLRKEAYLTRSLELSKDVKSEGLRERSEQRRTALTEAFMTLGGRAREAGQAFAPIMASLEDCRRFMKADFTTSSAADLKPELEVIQKNKKALDDAADALVADLSELQAKVSTGGGVKK